MKAKSNKKFAREHIDRLNNKIGVLEARNQALRAMIEKITHGEPARWTPFVEVKQGVFGDGSIVGGSGADPTGNYLLFVNSRYQVAVYKRQSYGDAEPMDLLHLSIKRIDGAAIRDWRELQRIKNELVGPEHEGCELFPAESRLVDGANQYHVFVLADPQARFPFGFGERLVSEDQTYGCQQRPFDADQKPDDLREIKLDQMRELLAMCKTQPVQDSAAVVSPPRATG